jgi:hypothetical protein
MIALRLSRRSIFTASTPLPVPGKTDATLNEDEQSTNTETVDSYALANKSDLHDVPEPVDTRDMQTFKKKNPKVYNAEYEEACTLGAKVGGINGAICEQKNV